MPNLLTRAVAAVRGNPALAVAVGGVGLAAAVSVGRRGGEEAPPTGPAVAGGSASPIAGYGAGLVQPLPGPDFGYSNESAMQNAALLNAINAQSDKITAAIKAQAARTPAVPVTPPKPTPSAPTPRATLPADLGTIVIGLRQRYPDAYASWLRYAGSAGRQQPDESSAARRARLTRELNWFTQRITTGPARK